MEHDRRLRKLHSMEEFGLIHGSTKEVRVTGISGRVHPKVAFPHKHDFYQLLVVARGSGWHEIDFLRYPIRPLSIFFLKPGQVHRWQTHPKSKGYIVEFTEEALVQSSLVLAPTWSVQEIPDRMDFSKAAKSVLRTIFCILRMMQEEYDGQSADFEASLRHYLMPLLIEMHRYRSRRKAHNKKADALLSHFLFLLRDNFKKEHSVHFYAAKLKTSPKALTMRVSRSMGKPASEIIRQRCVLEAKRLLAHSALSVAEVGYEIGFCDPNYFSRFFKNSVGLKPGDFRTEARNFP